MYYVPCTSYYVLRTMYHVRFTTYYVREDKKDFRCHVKQKSGLIVLIKSFSWLFFRVNKVNPTVSITFENVPEHFRTTGTRKYVVGALVRRGDTNTKYLSSQLINTQYFMNV